MGNEVGREKEIQELKARVKAVKEHLAALEMRVGNTRKPRPVQPQWKAFVDTEKCIGCGECVEVCPVDVYEMQDEKSVPVNGEECLGCESCVEVCEQEAITVSEV